jgi:hypothetical protein
MWQRFMLLVVLSVASLVGIDSLPASAGVTLYPDLKTLPPSELAFDRLPGGTWVLRFTNTVANAGEGRLELQGEPNTDPNKPQTVYQNLYDADGTQTQHNPVATDTVFHPDHNHYHFTDFASSVLLKRDAGSKRYYETTKKGAKTTGCIVDWVDVSEAETEQLYTTCDQDLQGLTPGWADPYYAELDGQWVVLGKSKKPLRDGEYGLKSTADPRDLLDEGARHREHNNTAVTYFTVRNGQIRNLRQTP